MTRVFWMKVLAVQGIERGGLLAGSRVLALIMMLAAGTAATAAEPARMWRLPPVDESVAGGLVSVEGAGQVPVPGSDPASPAAAAESRAAKDPTTEAPATGKTEPEAPELIWYEYAIPTNWYVPDPWDASFELGIDGSEGNSQTLTTRTGVDIKRKNDWSDLRSDLTYVRSSTEKVETKHNARWNVEHDWLLKDSRWSLFGKSHLEYNEFTAYDVRWAVNGGLGYRFIKREATTWKGRLGAGVSREFGGEDNAWSPEAVLGMDLDHQLTKRQKLRATLDYTPEWADFADYRLRSRVDWEVLLDEATNMSLKFTLEDRYDSTPGGRQPNDLDYSVLLLWKL